MVKKNTTIIACKYNDSVDCNAGSKCSNCGWNPVVHEKRMREYHGDGRIVVNKWKLFLKEDKNGE